MPAIRNDKEVFTTNLPPILLEDLRQYCFSNKLKLNQTLEKIISGYLEEVKNDACTNGLDLV